MLKRFCAMVLLLPFLLPSRALGFTQRGFSVLGDSNPGIPMGHEWITRMAAMELIGAPAQVPPDVPDPNDPRQGWTQGLPKNTDISSPAARAVVATIKAHRKAEETYASHYQAIYSAVIGQRWVDLAGYNALTSRDCWNAVAQEAPEVQYNHFLRRWDDYDGEGGVNTARAAQGRFIDYFVEAAIAPAGTMAVYDGGATGSTAVAVDENFFLLGRAIHLLQDSFSSEHSVRIADDNYTTVRQVKSYLCSAGSEQHSHSTSGLVGYCSGDIVWQADVYLGCPRGSEQPGCRWNAYKPSSMKTQALVAVSATIDLFAAFIRTRAHPQAQRTAKARDEANVLVRNWLSFDEEETLHWYDDPARRGPTYVAGTRGTTSGLTVQQCMSNSGYGNVTPKEHAATLYQTRRRCLYNATPFDGYADLADPWMDLWYMWKWKSPVSMFEPPANWTVPSLQANSGMRVTIGSVANGFPVTAPALASNEWVYCRPGAPIGFVLVPTGSMPGHDPQKSGFYRTVDNPFLFLSYTGLTGAAKLHGGAPPQMRTTRLSGGAYSIRELATGSYMWLSGESPYFTRSGNPANADAQWTLTGR